MSQFSHQWLEEAEEERYFARLTGNPLLFSETRTLLSMMSEEPDPKRLQSLVMDSNSFHYKSTKSVPKRVNAILNRYRFVPEEVREFVYSAVPSEAQKVAFLVLAVRDRLLRDFLRDVILTKHQGVDPFLTKIDFRKFFLQKAEIDERVGQWTDSVLKKLESVITAMLLNIGMCTRKPELKIQKVILEPVTRELIINWFSPEYLAYLEGP
jgi:BrxA